MNHTKEIGEKPSFGISFGPFDPNLGPQNYIESFILEDVASYQLYVISRKTYDPNSIKWQKTSFWA